MKPFIATGKSKSFLALSTALCISLSLLGCKDKSAVSGTPVTGSSQQASSDHAPNITVSKFQLGSEIGPDYTVSTPKTEFSLDDTVYASSQFASNVDAKSSVDVTAKWTQLDANKVIKEETVKTEVVNSNMLNLAMNKADGMIPGKFRVEILLNGSPAASAEFMVK